LPDFYTRGVETIRLDADFIGPDLVPSEELADCARTALARDGRTLLSYGPAAGYAPLRALIGQWFGVHPGRVVLTNGALHGLALLTRHIAFRRNVVAEYPIYDRAEKVLLSAETSLVSAPMDEEGLNPDELQGTLVAYSTPAFVYTIPSFHNPTGRSTTYARRRRLLSVIGGESMVQVQGMVIVEDDSYALTRFEGEAEHAYFDLSGKETLYLSSFSTTIAPGLRVGWLILPEALADDLGEAAADTYITPSLLSQATVFEFLTRGGLERQLTDLRAALKLRRDAMLTALSRHLPELRVSSPEGGFYVWIELPGSPDGRQVIARAKGVSAVAGTAFSAMSSYVRLSYSAAAPDEIEAGIERLVAAL
jgi:2-aminoadipate transaminase